jgi:hypothetical protein
MPDDRGAFFSAASPSTDMMQGEITSHKQDPLSTLDEPVVVTIKRKSSQWSEGVEFLLSFGNIGDLRAVLQKFTHVLVPRRSSALLQQWDLGGPMILITTLAILLQTNTTKTSAGIQFAQVFLLMLVGAIAVTVGLPTDTGHQRLRVSSSFRSTLNCARREDLVLSIGLCAWLQSLPRSHRLLVLYPIFLFYFLTTCLILLHTHGK